LVFPCYHQTPILPQKTTGYQVLLDLNSNFNFNSNLKIKYITGIAFKGKSSFYIWASSLFLQLSGTKHSSPPNMCIKTYARYSCLCTRLVSTEKCRHLTEFEELFADGQLPNTNLMISLRLACRNMCRKEKTYRPCNYKCQTCFAAIHA